jgi:UDP-N-acetylmuramate--alanine ligase
MYQKQYHIHFVGIGGIGMSGIAELLINLGYKVSGSDLKPSDITHRLQELGGTVFKGHAAEQIEGADVVVVSSAIDDTNPEVKAAIKASVPVIPRAEMLAELMRLKYSIAVAGAHGKTSTTSLVASVLAAGDLDPTVVIGGKLNSIGVNAFLGQGDYIVAEADESDGSFLKYSPAIAVITNIDREHLDYYKDMDDIKAAFLTFLDRIPFYGLAVLCMDNEAVQDVIPGIRKRYVTYGMNPQADLQARDVVCRGLQSAFKVIYQGDALGEVCLNMPGEHNVYNAMAAVAVGLELGIGFDRIKGALESAQGVQRRLEIKGTANGVTVVDDYGHHPTEIKTTLSALEQGWPQGRKWVVFQPHRYSRTQMLYDDFVRSFYQADTLLVLPIYPASEKPIAGVNSRKLCEGIESHGHKDVRFVNSVDAVVELLTTKVAPGDVLLTLGAGNVYRVGEQWLQRMGADVKDDTET